MSLHKLILMLVICIPYFSNARSFYSIFIPDDILMQFAGNQGMLSVGFGYSYEISKRNRTTAFMYGYLAMVSVAQAQATTSTDDVA